MRTHRLSQAGSWKRLIELPSVTIQVVQGKQVGRAWTLALDSIRIGSAPENDVVLEDASVSATHARIRRTENGLLLEDAGSTNGTFIGRIRTTGAFLEPGMEVRLGVTVLRVEASVTKKYAVARARDHLGPLVGASAPMEELFAVIEAVAKTPATVLLQGESGTGKELVARALHEGSGRSGPLVTFDCASTSPEFVQAALFGHLKGAFTGAADARVGAFAQAHGGTLFLDEIQALPLALQPVLLRALEHREVMPLGADQPRSVNVRVIAASNEDLEARVKQGTFRLDLLHRLRVVPVRVPGLRERAADIPLLVEHFARALELPVSFTPEALEKLGHHDWPGNVRELRNLVERLGVLSPDAPIGPERLAFGAAPPAASRAPAPQSSMDEIERRAILDALIATGGNRTHAAKKLGISLATIKRRLADYGLTNWKPDS